MPVGSKSWSRSGLIRTPKEARMPKAAGCWRLRSATVARSAGVRAWKIISMPGAAERVARAASARGPLPKKMT